MSFTTFSGPLRSGTVKEGSGVNTGLPVLAQSVTVAATVAKTSGPVAQALVTLPAGSKIVRFQIEKTVAISGNSVSEVAAVIGTSGTANKYMTSANIAIAAGMTAQATLDAATVSAETNNIGTSDVTLYGTFTASTGNPTAGSIVITVHYIQRNSDGSQVPASA